MGVERVVCVWVGGCGWVVEGERYGRGHTTTQRTMHGLPDASITISSHLVFKTAATFRRSIQHKSYEMSFNKPLSDGEPIDVDETQQPQYPDDAFDTQQLDDFDTNRAEQTTLTNTMFTLSPRQLEELGTSRTDQLNKLNAIDDKRHSESDRQFAVKLMENLGMTIDDQTTAFKTARNVINEDVGKISADNPLNGHVVDVPDGTLPFGSDVPEEGYHMYEDPIADPRTPGAFIEQSLDASDGNVRSSPITPTQEMPPIENRSPNANGQDRQPIVPTLDNTAPSFYSGGSTLAESTRFAVDSGGSILAASIDQTTDLICNSSKQPGRKYDSRASSSTDPDPKKARH